MKKNAVYSTEGSIWKSLLLTFPMIFLILLFISGGKPDFSTPEKSFAFLVTFLFCVLSFFQDIVYRQNRQVPGRGIYRPCIVFCSYFHC